MTTLAIPPLGIRAWIYSRILCSSTTLSEKVLPPYQLESQPRTTPNLNPTGLIFCPIYLFLSFLFFYLRGTWLFQTIEHKRYMVRALPATVRTSLRSRPESFQ